MKSRICTQEQLESKEFQDWAERLKEQRGRMHRKLWEYCFIIQALYERNLLQPNVSGLGFGVGIEPLASLFCSFDASICATDISTDIAKESGWVDTSQHAAGLESLNLRELCPDELFDKNCTFQHADMNDIPDNLRDFDFVWSSCALEHLGSIQKGKEFIYNAMDCLKPGGIAVHTTEYNVSSNIFTLKQGGTVLFRQRDIKNIIRNLRRKGHHIEMDFTLGTLPNDQFIDVPPYKGDPHLKLKLNKYVITSIGLIIQKAK